MYLVVECSTMSAPSSSGCCSAGEAKVLSTNTFMFDDAASCAIAPMSAMRQQRVGGRLDPDQPGLRGDRRAHGVEVGQRDGGVVDAPLREHLVDQPEGSAVGVVGHDDVVTRPQQRAQRAVGGGHARAERPAVGGLLDRGQRRLQGGAGRIAGAGVLVAAAQSADAVLGERRAGVDRRVDGAGAGIGTETRVDRLGGQAPPPLYSFITDQRSDV